MAPVATSSNGNAADGEGMGPTGMTASPSYEFKIQRGKPETSSSAHFLGVNASGESEGSGAITPPHSVVVSHEKVQHFFGGNVLDSAPPGPVTDFVRKQGGHTVITKVLICNNGIAAVKEIRSIRKWAYETFGDERAIEFTVMATPEDLKVNADYIRMAEQYVEVPGGSNNNNYANVDLIVDIAERAGVHAVWAGWGHASENPRLPESLAASPQKIVFIGPPGSAMRSLGDKISSTIVAQHADVPCMPWSGTGITETMMSEQGFLTVSDDVYQQACIHSAEEGLEKAQKIGFPVMIKASEGGGGKGIRMCKSADEFKQLYNAALGEVPGSPIFVMKLAGKARHLEVQLLADQYGNAISIFGRDCSVQRRHQKIIEEAPVTIAPEQARDDMEKAAVRLAKLVGYVSAGTVEWLYSPDSGDFAFLELNPRLQVEHPTTEMVSGVNIPAAQLQVAMGIPLNRIRDIRTLYGMDPRGSDPIDFDFVDPESHKKQRKPQPKGHVVACRITAENPDTGFKPGMGALTELTFRSSDSVWGYFSVQASGGLHEFADSQFGHLFAYSPSSRDEARKNMIISLKELSIRGDFRTTVEYLIRLLETPTFIGNSLNTGWLDRLIVERFAAERPPRDLAVVAGAAVHAHLRASECEDNYRRILSKGQVPPRTTLQSVFTNIEFIHENVKYSFTASRASKSTWSLFLNGVRILVSLRQLADGGLLMTMGGGKSHPVYFQQEVGSMRLSIDARTCIIEEENDPTQITAPSPGKLQRLLVDSGDHVNAGDVLAEIEVMKMYLPLIAAEDAIVSWVKSPGTSIAQGDVLGILALDDPSKVQHAKPFSGQLPDFGMPVIVGQKPEQRYAHALEVLTDVLEGFDQSFTMHAALAQLDQLLRDPALPFGQSQRILSALSSRMPAKLEETVRSHLDAASKRGGEFPASRIRKVVESFLRESVDVAVRGQVETTLAPFTDLLDSYAGGLQAHEAAALAALLEQYYAVESRFTGEADIVLELRKEAEDDLSKVVAQVHSHLGLSRKNGLVLAILDKYVAKTPYLTRGAEGSKMLEVLNKLATLEGKAVAPVALKAREVAIAAHLPSLEDRKAQMEGILKASVSFSKYGDDEEYHTPNVNVLRELADSQYSVYDVLHSFWGSRKPAIAFAALVTYVLRAYRAYDLVHFDYAVEDFSAEDRAVLRWQFQLANAGEPAAERKASETDLEALKKKNNAVPEVREGLMTSCGIISDLSDVLPKVCRTFKGAKPSHPVNVINIAITDDAEVNDSQARDAFVSYTNKFAKNIEAAGVRRVTFLQCQPGQYPWFTTLRRSEDGKWEEERAIRNIEPALAYQLELSRLVKNFEIVPVPITSSAIHLYYARSRQNPSDMRFFVRALIRPGRITSGNATDFLVASTDKMLSDVLDMLEVAEGRPDMRGSDDNHIFLSFLYDLPDEVEFEKVSETLAGFVERHGPRLFRLRVTNAEIRLVLTRKDGSRMPLRFFIFNETGFQVRFEGYQEHVNDSGRTNLKCLFGSGRLNGENATFAYEPRVALQTRRARAHALQTTFCHDLVAVFREALRASWKGVPAAPEDPLSAVSELVLDEEEDNLRETQRPAGTNKIGMVAWLITAKTPEYPEGRQLVIIANDVTIQAGSFGPAEDRFFAAASKLARQRKIPRLYVSANSGARIGLATEPLDLFQVKFVNNDPTKGFEYLYLDDAGMEKLNAKGAAASVVTEATVATDGKRHHVITDVIGLQQGLGVECLSGSGLIAGETSRATQEIFTTTIVTGRSVGIGAYLARLGERVIQVEGSPMILTGYQALNKLLGREVYTSNLQLGGPQIMYRNGVSHLTAADDLAAMKSFVRWLSYVPSARHAALPLSLNNQDGWDRPVGYTPPKGPYDPRHLLDGTLAEDGKTWLSGIFDKGSWQETLAGWATSVVVGRARLGGIPTGVIAVETRTLERVVPADPANPNSNEQRIMEAGQVWYPNSAHKTAQAIADINREGLPLMILANWRGFSGGQEDMFQQILKFGSMIVDNLVNFKQPVFVYLPPGAELRGGAWVVIDRTINENGMMEMYADPTSRGGVLEPEGIVSVKYRHDKQRETMLRLDSRYAELVKSGDKQASAAREKELSPIFNAIAVAYADLHDKTGRMAAMGVIRQAVPWSESRRYFYQRLRRRLVEEKSMELIMQARPGWSSVEARTFLESVIQVGLEDVEDGDMAGLIEQKQAALVEALEGLKRDAALAQINALAAGLDEGTKQRVLAALQQQQ
ncbi:putative acetyl-CoA carboxylase [Jaminaea rosea]|uniref:Putative acetyl-CoA carboxylase n=1 Tax=Jaminaea rosea TaxID=1569628 RepID=A0A316UUW9_9BASI|nr:putative acetyl-CoA carboxylase [Jaminaea rosea]PWN29106.1 putative acetyl-CoA carboxylase [Jaminaea rosea]